MGGLGEPECEFLCDAAWEAIAAALVLRRRQAEIVRLLAEGRTIKEIARRVGRSPNTIYAHLRRVEGRLGVNGQAELVVMINRRYRQLRAQSPPSSDVARIVTLTLRRKPLTSMVILDSAPPGERLHSGRGGSDRLAPGWPMGNAHRFSGVRFRAVALLRAWGRRLAHRAVFRGGGYESLRVCLGILLLGAAALKAYQLATQGVVGAGLLESRWLIAVAVAFETLFGLWLLAGRRPRATWFLALACFSAFAVVSLYKGLHDQQSCGCFGPIAVSPWLTFGLNCSIVLSLLATRPVAHHVEPQRSSVRGAALFGVVGAWMAAGIPVAVFLQSPRVAEVLAADDEDLDMGLLWVQDELSWHITARNMSDQRVQLTGFKTSCNCVSIEPDKLALAPREVARLHLRLDFTKDYAQEKRHEERPFTVHITPQLSDPHVGHVTWLLRGRLRLPFAFSATVLDFGDVAPPGFARRSRTILANCFVPDTRVSVRCDPEMGSVHVLQREDSVWPYAVDLRLRDGLAPGTPLFPITFAAVRCAARPHGSNTEGVAEARVHVIAHVAPAIRTFPEQVSFGVLSIGHSASETISLSSASAPFVVFAAECQPSAALTVAPLLNGEAAYAREAYFRISVNVGQAGIQEGQVRFVVARGSDESPQTICVPVRWEGFPEPPT